MPQLSLEQRLARVERSNRLLRWVLIVLALLVGYTLARGTLFPISAMRFKYVFADYVSVFDDQDRLVGRLSKEGRHLALFDENGTARVWVVGEAKSPGMTVCDAKGESRASVEVEDDQPVVRLYDAERTRLRMTTSQAGPALELFSAAGETAASISEGVGHPSVRVYDDEGRFRAYLGFHETRAGHRTPAIELLDERNVSRFVAHVPPTGPIFGMRDSAGRYRCTFGTDDAWPYLSMRDGEEKLRFGIQLNEAGSPLLNLTDRNGKAYSRPVTP